jgi:histidyl-tRNA synthetase
MNTPQTLKGFRDFLPKEALKRKYLIDTITTVFQRFGFDPLETPALEYGEILMGKYGEEADKLLYMFKDRGGRDVGMRYDQTVPLARVIAQYQDIPKPFKRYQIQPVWRAENTQRGRYREFLQCDADIIGDSYSSTADAEILSLLWNIYKKIGFTNPTIVVNSRVILRKLITESLTTNVSEEVFLSIVRSLDKLDKVGTDGVKKELLEKNISDEHITTLFKKISSWKNYTDYKQIMELDENLGYSIQMATENFGVPTAAIRFDPTLARGLDYYTGIIFEAVDISYPGSLGGGGRYDKLIGSFTGKDTTAVGFAIGFDRTLEVAEINNLLDTPSTTTQVLVAYEDDTTHVFPAALNTTTTLRQNNINTEMYLNPTEPLDKQKKYAAKKGIPYVISLKKDMVGNKKVLLENFTNGEKNEMSLEEAISIIKTSI